ncbi:hypothetical protein HQ529_06550 [Candidatus Woesearchaeota archaeon]|nr:hypothetical protein [Candidatus Woesearchaeota archaeon]
MVNSIYEEIKEYTSGTKTEDVLKDTYKQEKYDKDNTQKDMYGNAVEEEDKAEYHRMDEEDEDNKAAEPSIEDKIMDKYKSDDEVQNVIEHEPVEVPEQTDEKEGISIEELAKIQEQGDDDEEQADSD